jgi:hypothetical protein
MRDTRNDKPPRFRSRGIIVGFKDDNPTTSNEDATLEGKLTILTPSSEGKKLHQKGQHHSRT